MTNGHERRSDSLERARIRTIYGNGLLIVFLVVFNTVSHANIDAGVLATLIGGEVTLFGIGVVKAVTR